MWVSVQNITFSTKWVNKLVTKDYVLLLHILPTFCRRSLKCGPIQTHKGTQNIVRCSGNWGCISDWLVYLSQRYTLCSCQCCITMSRGWTPHPWNFCLRRRKQTPGCLGEWKADQGNTGWLLLCTAVLGEGKSLNFIMVTVVQLYKHSENHWNKHFKWKDYGMHALYLSKALKSS